MTSTVVCNGWACVDCLMILANGEDNPEWSEAEAQEHHANMARHTGGLDVTLGLLWEEHEDDCPNREARSCVVDCYCERDEFSWRSCDVCGSTLGGERHAVAFWEGNQ